MSTNGQHEDSSNSITNEGFFHEGKTFLEKSPQTVGDGAPHPDSKEAIIQRLHEQLERMDERLESERQARADVERRLDDLMKALREHDLDPNDVAEGVVPEVRDEVDGPGVQPLLGTEEPDPMEWRVADFVPEDHLTMLIGDGGTGKSILALHLALCICTGRAFLGMGTKKGRVLYIDHELDRDEQLRRVHRIARAMGIDASDTSLSDRFQYWRPTHPLGSKEHQENLLAAVDVHEIDLVILDSLTMGAEGDVTDVADVVPIMQDVRQWPTTVAIDHVSHNTAKGSAAQARAFGSVFKRNAARSSLTLAQSETGGYALQQEKSNFSEGDGRLTYAVEWSEEEITFEPISDADERAQGLLSDLSTKDVTLVAVEDMHDGHGQAVMPSDVVQWREDHDVSAIGEGTVRNHYTALKKQGKITTDKHGGARPISAQYEASSDPPEDPPF